VRVNGNDISDEKLAEAFHAVNVARKDITLSYFEFTTLAAFWVFAQLNLDVWVLEVGLGGRLDAVNIIDPDIAVITNVGLDHQGFLGDTLEEIGLEKSGICRKNKALVLGSDSFPPRVREFQLATGAHVYDFNTIHGVTQDSVYWQDGSISVEFIGIPYPNAAAALQAFELSPFDITHQQIQQAFADIKMAGRMQLFVRNGRKITVDVGHNPHAANYISSQLSREKHHLVLGMLGDKDPKAFLKELESNVLSVNTISLDVPRGLSASELAERLDTSGVRAFTSLAQCFNHLDQHYPGEPLFIGGSFYTVCEALTFLEN
jgi:dihydrofolate synthase/folylpolyglutamate synthase